MQWLRYKQEEEGEEEGVEEEEERERRVVVACTKLVFRILWNWFCPTKTSRTRYRHNKSPSWVNTYR